MYKCGSCPAEKPSDIIGYLEEDRDQIKKLLPTGKLNSRFIRNTNVTGVYQQRGGTCYVYAACSAYLNTVMRKFGVNKLPTFSECFQIAIYAGTDGGNCQRAIEELEKHFHYGVKCDKVISLPIRETISISVIVCFTTSKEGWDSVSNGSLLKRPQGDPYEWHATLVEGYDFNKDCMICKNSWAKTGAARFDLNQFMTDDYYFIRVYTDEDNIDGKTRSSFRPNLKKFTGKWNNNDIECAWMDETAALYCRDYLCEHHPERNDNLKYLGYNIDQWININLNRDEETNQYYLRKIREKEKGLGNSKESCKIC